MNTIKVSFTQFSERSNSDIGFIVEDTSDFEPSPIQVKRWAALQLFVWFKTKELLGIKTFYKSRPIKIEAFVNTQKIGTFMQKRITKDTIYRENIDVSFPFLTEDNLYLLTNFSHTQKQLKKPSPSKIKFTNPNKNKYLNTIDRLDRSFTRFGSPIIYTGWTN